MTRDERRLAWAEYMREYRQRHPTKPGPGFWSSLAGWVRWQLVALYRRARGR